MCLSNVDNQIFYINKNALKGIFKTVQASTTTFPHPGILFNYIKFICVSLSVPVFRCSGVPFFGIPVFRCSVFRCSGVPGFTNSPGALTLTLVVGYF